MVEVKPVQTIQLETLTDLVKLLVSSIREPVPITLLHFAKDGVHYFFATQVLQSYYEWKGLPLTFYATTTDEEEIKPFIAYKTGEDGEELKFLDKIHDLSYRYLAVVNVKSIPDFLLPIQ